MADISMCSLTTCPLNLKCYRYMAKPNPHRQAYADFNFKLNEQGEPECDYFWPIKTEEDDKINKPFV